MYVLHSQCSPYGSWWRIITRKCKGFAKERKTIKDKEKKKLPNTFRGSNSITRTNTKTGGGGRGGHRGVSGLTES